MSCGDWGHTRVFLLLFTAYNRTLMRTGYQTFDRIVFDIEITLRILRQMGLAQREYGTAAGYIHGR